MTPDELLSKIDRLFAERGGGEYHGAAVSQLEHALQSAAFAEAEGAPPALIAAALLHDIGHLLHAHNEDCATHGIDDTHEELGVRFVAKSFGEDVTEPVRLHVAAKRYLCGDRPAYLGTLSAASLRSLQLQGGPMGETELVAFRRNPHFADAIRLREWDDKAKVVGLETPPFSHFRKYLEAAARA
ncbi:MAG TPA: HD domain-containing protein [Gemmataceae bacterium]|nr:HD domain-containing protein [Gemmataceae bacterium]